MYKELAGNMDINISHDLSKRGNARRDTIFTISDIDMFSLFRINIKNSNVKGVQ